VTALTASATPPDLAAGRDSWPTQVHRHGSSVTMAVSHRPGEAAGPEARRRSVQKRAGVNLVTLTAHRLGCSDVRRFCGGHKVAAQPDGPFAAVP